MLIVSQNIIRILIYTVILFPLCAAAEIIDNTDAGFSTTGVWSASTSTPGYYGSNYLFAATGNGSAVATWSYTVGSAGNYGISARWTSFQAPWRATNATYKIYNNGILLGSVSKDQTAAGGQFNLLGNYSLSAGTLEVKLSNAANNNYVAADAINIENSSTSTSTTIVDNSNAGFSMTGAWSASTSTPGYYGSNYLFAATGNGSAVATWSYTVGSAGNYGISARWTAFEAPWRATNATYKIYNNGILLGSVSKDQTAAGGQFNLLGNYSLSAGTLEVKLSNAANNNYVVADAVKIDGSSGSGSGSGSTNAAPNGTIDNPASSTVTIIKGGSVVFAGTGKDTDNNTPLSHHWSFGDGAIANSTQEDPGVVIYNNPGVYTATYTVTDALGLPDPTPATVRVTVVPRADPIAIVDNSDAGFSTTGVWNSSASIPGYYGNNYLVAATGNGSAVATWNHTIGSAGIYEISARWTAFEAPWRATNATYKIYNNGALLTSVSKDQTFLSTQGPQGNFELLGAYHLSAGTLQVKLSNAANNNFVAADAIQIVKLPANIQYYVGIGDSLTWGWGDNVTSDDVSADGRDSGLHKYFGGYEPILNNMLTNYTGLPHTIKNEGLGGAKSADGLARMFPPYDILNRYTVAQRYLVFFGMNDASPFLPVPSGVGLSPGNPGYPGTFKDNMQQIIDAINAYGQEVVLAKCPIALGNLASGGTLYPDLDNGTKNLLIQEYNVVIDELRAIPGNNISVIPPDLYNYFKGTYTTEYSDNFHPNGVGYQSLANQWFNALTP